MNKINIAGILFLFIFFGHGFADQFDRVKLLMNDGKYAEAVETLKEMPVTPARDLHLGLALVQSGEPEEAKRYLIAALRENPGLIPASYTLAMIYEKEKSYDSAIEQWQNVAEIARDRKLKELAQRHIELLRQFK